MKIFTIKSSISLMLSICLLVGTFTVSAQTVVTHETFPNQYNANFPWSNNTNGTFAGSSGTWTASCNSNSLAAIAVIPAYYSAVTNAVKIVNFNTSGKGAADCHAASPTVNLSGYTCSPNLNLSFKLYTYTCSASDPNSFFKVEFSSNNGSTWTSVLSMSSAQLFAAYGSHGLTTLTVPIPATYRVSGFKYRYSGYKPANESHNFYLFVDEAKINATTCGGGSIGDRVWYDEDADGIQDAGENQALSGITVQLKNTGGTVLATTTTNAGGNYVFSGLAAGTYKVDFPLTINGGSLTIQNVGSNDNIDSDASQTNGETGNITLATNQNITHVDAGYNFNNLSLGNRVWYDANNNGRDGNENGIRNVTVNLYRDNNNDNVADGASIATDITNVDGYYKFTNLVPGNYIVGVVLPAGYMSSSVNGGDPDNNKNRDDNGQVMSGNEIRGLAITLSFNAEPSGGGDENNTYDFGLLPDCACTTSPANLLTNASFENGTTGWSWSSANGSLTTGTGYVACGTKNGFNNQSSGTSKVWQDVNISAGSMVTFNAFAGTHAPGINCSPKLSLIFLNSQNVVLGQSDVNVTRIVGDYHNQLEQYAITAIAPSGTVKVRVQSSITCNTMKLDAFCLTVSPVPPLLGTIGNKVWYDTNNNGINDATENGIRGVTVKLYRDVNNDNVADGAAIATQVTDVDGYYAFTNLSGGNYIVGAVLPNGYMSSSVNGGDPDNNIDLDDNGQVPDGIEVRGLAITITSAGNTNNTYDFGMLPDCACTTSPANLLTNASFENGTTGWSWSSANGSLTTGTGYVACGTKNGFNNQSSGTSKVWQDVNISAGSMVTFKAFAGIHAPGINCSPKLSLIFLNSENVVIGQTDVNVTRVVGDYHNQLAQYAITAFAPSGTVKVRVQSSITCNTMKLDAFCLTATAGGPLPITMSEFTAAKNNCTANLNWKTSSEVNGDRFEVEVSTNSNAVYTTAGTVMAAGNSSSTRSYQYSYLMQPGVSYFFRLKMIDKDGYFKYSDIRSLSCTAVKGIVIAPNPVITRFTISGMENGKNFVAVYDLNGRLMKTQVIVQSQGEVDIFNLAPGYYSVKITGESGNTVINKIVKY